MFNHPEQLCISGPPGTVVADRVYPEFARHVDKLGPRVDRRACPRSGVSVAAYAYVSGAGASNTDSGLPSGGGESSAASHRLSYY